MVCNPCNPPALPSYRAELGARSGMDLRPPPTRSSCCPGWLNSPGAFAEVATALAIKIPCYIAYDDGFYLRRGTPPSSRRRPRRHAGGGGMRFVEALAIITSADRVEWVARAGSVELKCWSSEEGEVRVHHKGVGAVYLHEADMNRTDWDGLQLTAGT